MPIYGYVCKSCGHELDALQKISDDPLVDCPDCGEPQLRRQLSALSWKPISVIRSQPRSHARWFHSLSVTVRR